MTDKRAMIKNMKNVESVLNEYINDNNLSLDNDISDILVDNCRFRVANVLNTSFRASRHYILICFENMQYKHTHSATNS